MSLVDIVYKGVNQHATANATAATATATLAAPGAAHKLIVTGYEASAGATATTASTLTLKDGTTTLAQLGLPAAAFGPVVVQLTRPYVISANSPCTLALTTLGTGIIGYVNLHGFIVEAEKIG